jgi:hypothetical protein
MYYEYINRLKEACKKRKWVVKGIGRTGKKKEYEMFCVTNNPSKYVKKVCFLAGMHGDEIAGPWAVIKFIEKFDARKFGKIKITIFPVGNPSGFDKGKRRDYLNKDLNEHFCGKTLFDEDKIIYNAVKNEKIFFVYALHEDVGETRFYLYNFEKGKEKIYREIIKFAGKYVKINKDKKIYGDKSQDGIIINTKDCSFEDRLFRDDVPFSMCTESPGKLPLAKRVDLNVKVMNFVLKFALRH